MDWTVEDNMVDRLFFCATLTGRRGGHTSFAKTVAQTSDISAEAVEPDPGSSWEGHFGCVGAGVGDENAESCGVARPLRIPLMIRPMRRTMLLLSGQLMSCCAAGTNVCLHSRRSAFALDGLMSDEWTRCPGSMARRARGSVAPLR